MLFGSIGSGGNSSSGNSAGGSFGSSFGGGLFGGSLFGGSLFGGGGGFEAGGLFGSFGTAPKLKAVHPTLLKARKNLDLPTSSLHLVNLDKRDKPFSRTAIKLLLSKHAKRRPFGKMHLSLKEACAFNKSVANKTKKFSYDTNLSKLSDDDFIRTFCCSFNHLEHLDVSKLNMQSKSSLASISKLTHLQSLKIRLQVGNLMVYPRFFKNLKELRHINLSISESPQRKMTDFVPLARFFKGLALLPSLESYCINIRAASIYEEHSGAFIEVILENLTLLKAKKFSVKIHCSESLKPKIAKFTSFLEKIDAYAENYMVAETNDHDHFKRDASRKLILVWQNPKQRGPSESFLSACTSLENLYIEQNTFSISPNNLHFPKTLKALTILFDSPQLAPDFSQDLKAWQEIFGNLDQLENLSLILRKPDTATILWTQKLPQLESLKNLKEYHLDIEEENSFFQVDYSSFFTEWTQSLKNLAKLEVLDLKLKNHILNSLDFFTEALANLPQIKHIKLHIVLHQSQQKGKFKLSLPSQNLPKLDHIWLCLSEYVSKGSAAKLLQDIGNCENLQSLTVSGLVFDEETAISTLKNLTRLKTLQIETTTRNTLRVNSKKEFIKT